MITKNEYVQTGISYFPQLPATWGISKMKYLVSINDEVLSEKTDEDFQINYVEISDVDHINGLKNYTTYSFKEAPSRARRIVKEGDILVSTVRTYLKAIARIDKPIENLVASTGFAVLRPKNINSRYLGHYVLSQNFIDETIANSVGISYPAINSSQIGEFKLPVPPPEVQLLISNFLDEKSNELDGLILKKRKLIEFLKEEKVARINTLITRGLDSKNEFVKSNVNWAPEVPKHWTIKSFRHCIKKLTDFTSNGSFASLAQNVNYYSFGYSRLVRLTDLRENMKNEGLYVDENAHNFLSNSELFGGELLLANVGAYAGLAMLMPKLEGKFTLGPNMFLIRVKGNTKYFFYLLNYTGCAGELRMKAVSSAQPKLNKDNVKELYVVEPPLNEQTEIVKIVEQVEAEIDSTINKIRQEIRLIEEYRTSLISEIVTGKTTLN